MTDPREIPFARPWIGDEERAAAARVLDGHVLTHGPECKGFEAEFGAFLGAGATCVTVSSCMAALHLAYLRLGIGSGDEVIVPALTHVATAHAVEAVGARPVFVDCEAATGNVTAAGVEAALTPRTRTISVVHFAGIPCDMPAIAGLAARRGLAVVEDCALAVGARWGGRHVGLFGDAGCFSFYPVKHITTGEGGMFVSASPGTAAAVARLRAFGVDRSHAERSTPGMYEVPSWGLNYRMSEIQAAIGRAQVARLPEILRRRRENFAAWRAALTGVSGVRLLDAAAPEAENARYCLVAVVEGARSDRRDAVAARLRAEGVGTSVYYPQPVPRMAYYRERYGYDAGRYPEAERISDGSIALPVGPHLREGDVARMSDALSSALES